MLKVKIIIVLCCFLPTLAHAGEPESLIKETAEYRRELSNIEASHKTASLEALLQQGNNLASELKKIIEQLSDSDYSTIEKNLKGYIVNREEVILVEPDTRFFSKLADKIGTIQDRLYFNFMLKVMPDGYWPVYIIRQTDVGGCTDFGKGTLSSLYREGSGLLPKLSGYYQKQITRITTDIADQLTSSTCACGKIDSAKKEFKIFQETNPKAPITESVSARMKSIQRGDPPIRENCIGGR